MAAGSVHRVTAVTRELNANPCTDFDVLHCYHRHLHPRWNNQLSVTPVDACRPGSHCRLQLLLLYDSTALVVPSEAMVFFLSNTGKRLFSSPTAVLCRMQGPWIENYFFDYFTSHPDLNAQLQRVYVPICFTDAVLQGMSEDVTKALAVRASKR